MLLQKLLNLLTVLLVAVTAILVCAPFLVIERRLGFAVLIIYTSLFFGVRRRLGLQARSSLYTAGFVIAFMLSIPGAFFARVAEGGFDDGPFRGRPYAGDINQLQPSDNIPFRQGNLVIYNREDSSPVIAYRIGEQTKWTTEMFVSTDPGSDVPELHLISQPSFTKGLVRDRLDFIGTWTFGGEHSYAYIWKFGGIQKFYLGW